ncbi:hypothetical protein [Nocardioides zeicaulis]|uniref:Uncharacterized protein n=1 Tax=Nocardioides zeicaulis TaxID=1776857 RepID=A0ABV6E455_9ACTN
MARRPHDPDGDFAGYLAVRWPDLVGGLEAEGIDPDAARLAVAVTMLGHRRGWSRLVREQQVDVVLWSEARERAGLVARPGEAAPHGVGVPDPADPPEPWLERAREVRAGERRRTVRRTMVGLAVVAVLAAGWTWWATRPEVAPVREEANPLPVAWYSGGELHLADVVVGLPDVDEFVADGADVVARLGSGDYVRVRADGDVEPLDAAPAQLADTGPAPAYLPPGRYDTRVQSVPLPGGGWAHLIDSSRRSGAQDAVRRSESGRRALVVCPTESTCQPPITITATDGSVRLR